MVGSPGHQLADPDHQQWSPHNAQICAAGAERGIDAATAPNGGYARASYASGGGGASRVPPIAGDVTAGPALVSCVLVSYAPCAERRRL
jgi:hypothetical protein